MSQYFVLDFLRVRLRPTRQITIHPLSCYSTMSSYLLYYKSFRHTFKVRYTLLS